MKTVKTGDRNTVKNDPRRVSSEAYKGYEFIPAAAVTLMLIILSILTLALKDREYSENENMAGAKTKVVQGAATTSYTIGGLTKGKTYYISIRVRKKVGGINYYTTFGTAKKIMIEK